MLGCRCAVVAAGGVVFRVFIPWTAVCLHTVLEDSGFEDVRFQFGFRGNVGFGAMSKARNCCPRVHSEGSAKVWKVLNNSRDFISFHKVRGACSHHPDAQATQSIPSALIHQLLSPKKHCALSSGPSLNLIIHLAPMSNN